MAESRPNRSGFGFAGLLITLGVLLLLANMGRLPDRFLDALVPLWPLLLIAIGANLVISRYQVWAGSAAALAIVGVALGVAWWQAAADPGFSRGDVVELIRVDVGDASSARIDLTVAAGDLDLHAGAAGPLLIDGSLTTNYSNGALELSLRDQAGTRRVGLHTDRDVRFFPGFGRSFRTSWKLALHPDIPLELRIDGGAADLNLDLHDLTVKLLDVDSGAVSTTVVMPAAAGETRAVFDVGAASLEIEIPPGVAARLRIESALTSVQVDESRFPRAGDGEYRSEDFDAAANRVDLEINAGVSSVSVR